MPRCQIRNITNGKICLHKSNNIFIINNKRYCTMHMKYYNNIYATMIQSSFRAFKIRKKLNNIYKKLPYDIQNHILYYIRYDFYTEKLNKKLDILLENKIYNYKFEFDNKLYIDNNIPFTVFNYLSSNQKNIIHIYKLFVKYKSILTNKEIFNKIFIENLYFIKKIIYEYEHMIFNAYSNHIFELSCVVYYKIDKILNRNTILSSES